MGACVSSVPAPLGSAPTSAPTTPPAAASAAALTARAPGPQLRPPASDRRCGVAAADPELGSPGDGGPTGSSPLYESPSAAARRQKLEARRRRDVHNLKLAMALWLSIHIPDAKARVRDFLLGTPRHQSPHPPRAAATCQGADTPALAREGAASEGEPGVRQKPAGQRQSFDTVHQEQSDKLRRSNDNSDSGGGGDGTITVSVEAAGSGILLLRVLRVRGDMVTMELKKVIYARLPDRHPDTQLLFVGHGGKQLENDLFRGIEQYGIADGSVVVAATVVPEPVERHPRPKCIGTYDRSHMDELGFALTTADPTPVMRRLGLQPHHIPFWLWSRSRDKTDIWASARYYLDGGRSSSSRRESVLQFAQRFNLPCLELLRNWDYYAAPPAQQPGHDEAQGGANN